MRHARPGLGLLGAPTALVWSLGLVLVLGACDCTDQRILIRGLVSGDGGTGSDAALPGCVPLGNHCSGLPCACENCLDDDGDGRFDVGDDPECSSYLDDDEASFATALPGDNKDCRQDCFFDGNSGGGGFDCQVPTACLVDVTAFNAQTGKSCTAVPTNPAVTEDCQMSAACVSACLPYVPNGCDCYGCCDVVGADGATYSILVGSPCDSKQLVGGDYGSCFRCTPDPSCGNPCGRCELCAGKTVADLPPDCVVGADGGVPDGGAPTPACESGLACSGSSPCANGLVCLFGCCVPEIP